MLSADVELDVRLNCSHFAVTDPPRRSCSCQHAPPCVVQDRFYVFVRPKRHKSRSALLTQTSDTSV